VRDEDAQAAAEDDRDLRAAGNARLNVMDGVHDFIVKHIHIPP